MNHIDYTTGEVVDGLPVCDWSDPAHLEAHYGNFSYSEHLRKIVLANCREAVRARALLESVKHTVDRVDDLARISDKYVEFVTQNLHGRILRERNVRESRNGA